MSIPDYPTATNEAYRLLKKMLVQYGHFKIRTDILFILDQLPDVVLLSYTDACDKYNCERSSFTARSNYGFTIAEVSSTGRVRYIVLFNDWKDDTTIRFTLAHEIGHIVLGHTEDNEIAKKEANCFARNLLCPIPVRTALDLHTVSDLCTAFDVSEPMAEASLHCESSDAYHIDKVLYQDLYDISEIAAWDQETISNNTIPFTPAKIVPSFFGGYSITQRVQMDV